MMDERTTRVGGEFASITPSVVLPGGPGGVGQLLRSSVCLSASLAAPWPACHGVHPTPCPSRWWRVLHPARVEGGSPALREHLQLDIENPAHSCRPRRRRRRPAFEPASNGWHDSRGRLMREELHGQKGSALIGRVQKRNITRARNPLSLSRNALSSSWLVSCWRK